MSSDEKPIKTTIIEENQEGLDVEKRVEFPESPDTRLILGKLNRIYFKLNRFENLTKLIALMIFIIMVMLGVFVSRVL